MNDPAAALPPEADLGPVRVVRHLGGGSATDTWLVDTARGAGVLRIDRPLAAGLGLDRRAEVEVLQQVSAAGFGPEVLFAEPERGLLVTRFLPGHSLRPGQLGQADTLRRLGVRLRALHALPPAGRRFDPAAICEGYARQVATPAADQAAAEVAKLAAGLYRDTERLSICHNDLVSDNIIDNGPLCFIDWEYAAAGDPWFDLAVVVRHHRLGAGQAEVLMRAWHRTVPTGGAARLAAFCQLYDQVCSLWQAVIDGAARDDASD